MERRHYRLVSLLVPLCLWQGALSLGLLGETVLPPPVSIATTALAMFGDPGFLDQLLGTLRRTAAASTLAATGGTAVGFAMAANPTVKQVVSPVVSAIFALPVVAMFPLVILVLGSEDLAIVFTAAVGSFILVVWNARNGAQSIDPTLRQAARDNGAQSRWALFREVWLPGSLPLLFVGARLGLSMSLLIVVSVEFIAGDDGLGYVLWIAWQSYQLPRLYATLVVVGLLGIGITGGLSRLRQRIVPWDEQRTVVGP